MKKLICASQVKALVNAGEKTLAVDRNTIVTPAAYDALAAANISVIEQEVAKAPAVAGGDAELIYSVLSQLSQRGLLDQLLQVISAGGFSPVTRLTNGARVVQGDRVFTPDEIGPGKTAKKELVSKEEAAFSAGYLHAEQDSFHCDGFCEEVYTIYQGQMTVTVDRQEFTLGSGDMLYLPRNAKATCQVDEQVELFYIRY